MKNHKAGAQPAQVRKTQRMFTGPIFLGIDALTTQAEVNQVDVTRVTFPFVTDAVSTMTRGDAKQPINFVERVENEDTFASPNYAGVTTQALEDQVFRGIIISITGTETTAVERDTTKVTAMTFVVTITEVDFEDQVEDTGDLVPQMFVTPKKIMLIPTFMSVLMIVQLMMSCMLIL